MAFLIYGRDEMLVKWAAQRLPFGSIDDVKNCRAIGVQRKEHSSLAAVVVFNKYRPEFKSIEASIVIEDPYGMTKNVWRRMFAYAFRQLDCQAVYVSVPASNEKSVTLCEKLGFARDGKIRRFLGVDDLIVFSLLKEEAGKWLK